MILEEAVALGLERHDEVAAVIVWDGTRRGEPDYTADFAERSRERGMRVFEVQNRLARCELAYNHRRRHEEPDQHSSANA